MPVVDARGLEKSYGPRRVLAGVDVVLRRGERVGLVGRNGSGKSTLGRILAGVEEADAGEIARRRDSRALWLAQEPELPPDRSLRDIVLASLDRWSATRQRYDALTAKLAEATGDTEALAAEQAEVGEALVRLGGWDRLHEAEATLHDLGIDDPARLAGTLSGGERRRVALARVLVAAPELAVLDEPTNHLDIATIEWLETYLRDQFRGALLLITHDRYVLDRVATRTLELHDGQLESYDGGYARYLEARAERLAHAERSERNRQNFLRRELEWLRRQPKARGTKQKARVSRAEEQLARSAPRDERTAALRLQAERQGKSVLEIDGLTLERGGARLVSDLDLRVAAGQRIGVVGPNGSGKTSLLLAVTGALPPGAGTLRHGATTKVGYLDQERSGLDPERSVFEALGDISHVESGGETLDAASYLERFLFDRRSQRIAVGQLSGGERARVCLARLLAGRVNLLLLDEPTNDLDVATLSALETMLVDFAGSAIIVSHDRWFLDRVATSILAFEGDGRVELHAGNYSDYRERVQERETSRTPVARQRPAPKNAAPNPPSPPQRPNLPNPRLSYHERRELDGLLDRIDEAENEAGALEARLADPATYRGRPSGADAEGPDSIAALQRAFEQARDRVAELTARWEDLEGRREASEQ